MDVIQNVLVVRIAKGHRVIADGAAQVVLQYSPHVGIWLQFSQRLFQVGVQNSVGIIPGAGGCVGLHLLDHFICEVAKPLWIVTDESADAAVDVLAPGEPFFVVVHNLVQVDARNNGAGNGLHRFRVLGAVTRQNNPVVLGELV